MKNRKRFGKKLAFFKLKPTILDVWDISSGFISNWINP